MVAPMAWHRLKTLTPQHDRFIMLVVGGATLKDAYREAGFKAKAGNSIEVCASKLAKQPLVALSIAKQRQAVVQRVEPQLVVTVATITRMLAQAHEDAVLLNQPTAAVQAAMGLAKLHGFLIDRHEDVTRRPGRNPDVPVEIEVEHWVNEVKSLGAPKPNGSGEGEP